MKSTRHAAAGLSLLLLLGAAAATGAPRFEETDGTYTFHTGTLSGILKGGKGSKGLTQVTDLRSGAEWVISPGLFSLYRVFDRDNRYGDARDRDSQSRLLADGSVECLWPADDQNPFLLRSRYRWADPQSLDIEITVTATRDLPDFEVFLSAYLKGTDHSYGYAGGSFLEALGTAGDYHLFPRDKAARKMALDGRWQKPLHPVEWVVQPEFAAALGLRRDATTGATALVMGHPEDCFAVSMSHGSEPHHSLYLSLFGRTLESGQTSTVRARLVLGQGITDEEALRMYRSYVKEPKTH